MSLIQILFVAFVIATASFYILCCVNGKTSCYCGAAMRPVLKNATCRGNLGLCSYKNLSTRNVNLALTERISEASGPLLNYGYFIPLLDLVSEVNVFSSRKVHSNDKNGYML